VALIDGDPRTAAPELYAQLSAPEQGYADRAFQKRLELAGLNDPQYPDDEPAPKVAAEAVRAAARRLSARIAQGVWAMFLALALSTIVWPGLKGPFMLAMFLTAVALSLLSTLIIYRRRRHVARFLGSSPAPNVSAPPTSPMPLLDGELGPEQLAPALLKQTTRVERAVVKSFFPGSGRVSTGTPDWNGSAHDRLRLRRCFTAVNVSVLVVVWFFGSILLDAAVSAIANTKDGNLTGIFVLGWAAGVVWFVRRQLRVRRWYVAGLGREAELASTAIPVPHQSTPAPATSRQKGLFLAVSALGGVYFIYLGTTGVSSLNDDRIATHPYAGGTTTTGTVIRVHESDSGSTYRAISTFTDTRGHRHEVTGQSGEEKPRPRAGDEVRVSYRPSDPNGAREVSTNTGAWKFPMATMAFALLAGLAIAISTTIAAVRLGRTRKP
jgi:hypothetical protein